MVGDEDGEHSL